VVIIKKIISTYVKDKELIRLRRQQIIEGAVKLFSEKGFHKTTTREIARESGFSIGTLYEYIESKEDVLYLVCEAIHAKVEGELKNFLNQNSSGKERLIAAVRHYLKIMDEMQNEVIITYQETKSLLPTDLELVLQKEEEITKIFEKIINQGVADQSLKLPVEAIPLIAHNIILYGQMWAFRRWALAKKYSLLEYSNLQVELLLKELS